jgi:hypothetical protein
MDSLDFVQLFCHDSPLGVAELIYTTIRQSTGVTYGTNLHVLHYISSALLTSAHSA